MPLVAAVRKLSSTVSVGPLLLAVIVGPSSWIVSCLPRSMLAVWKSPSFSVIVAVKFTIPAVSDTPSPPSGLVPKGWVTARYSVKVTTPVVGSSWMVNASVPPVKPTWPSIVLPFRTSTSAWPVCKSIRPDAVPLPPAIDSA